MIVLSDVCKSYGTFPAVRDLSLTVEEGQLCCLIGPSGCGKSTALKMINRMIEPTGGTITIGGVDIRTVPVERLRRGIGYVIQDIGLFPHMTVKDNILVVPRLLGWEARTAGRRAAELLDLFELPPDEYLDKYPSELSGGQAQRVGVARALAADPKILLMDEPFGALDPISREHLQNQFLLIQRELKKTIVFVTHDIDEAIRLGSTVALLRDGRLVQHAAPETLLSAPADRFVKRFVGLDRALKRLSRLLTADFLQPAVSVGRNEEPHVFEESFRRVAGSPLCRYVWVTDEQHRLIGRMDPLSGEGGIDVEEDMVELDPGEMTVREDYSLKHALSLFVQQGVTCLPVIDDNRALRGELRLDDILRS